MHCLIGLSNALVAAKAIMSAPRMDSDNQTREAIDMVMSAYDRTTQKELRLAIDYYITANTGSGKIGS